MRSEVKQITLDAPISKISIRQKMGRWLAPIVLFLLDYIALVCALNGATLIRENIFVQHYPYLSPYDVPESYLYFLIPMTYLVLLIYEKLYTKRLPFWKNVELLFKVSTYASILTIGLLFFSHSVQEVSRIFMLFTWILTFFFLTISRYLSKSLLLRLGLWQKPVIIIGAGKTAEILAKTFEEEPGMGYKIIGFIEDHAQGRPVLKKYPLIGNFNNIEDTIQLSRVQDVMLATPGLEREALLNLIQRIQPHVNNLTIIPDLFGVPLTNIEVETLFNQKTVLFKIKNNMKRTYNRIFKRLFDYTATIIGATFISPVLIILAILIYLDSPGPVIFAHYRIGLNGKVFPCYKFRSMVNNSQQVLKEYLSHNPEARAEWERDFKLKNDPRVTKIGNFMRKTSLDELPQIFNVIKGQMSLVGPRPIVEGEVPKYGQYIHDYYLVRPGITGYWQISGRNDVDYESRVQMDSWYVRNWSLWQDIVILIKTVRVVLGRKGAY